MAKDPVAAVNWRGVEHGRDDGVTQPVVRRLRSIEGQVRGILRMVEEDQYCIDILTQISAVRAALNTVGMAILRRHVETCVAETIKDGGANQKEIIDELMKVLSRQVI